MPVSVFNILLICLIISLCCTDMLPHLRLFADYPIYSTGLGLILPMITSLLGIVVFLCARRWFQARINYLLLASFLLVCVAQTVGSLALPDSLQIPYGSHDIFYFNWAERIVFAFSAMSSCFALWIVFNFGPLGKAHSGRWLLLYEAFALIALFTIVYSLITEFSIYRNIIEKGSYFSNDAPSSWLGHKNAFARYIFIGILAELYLIHLDRRYLRYALVAVFCVAMFFTMSRTTLILTAIVVLTFCVIHGVNTWKTSRIPSVIHLAIPVVFAIIGLILFLSPISQSGLLGSFIYFLKNDMQIGGGGTIDARIHIWSDAITLWKMSPVTMLFGNGEYAFATMLGPSMDTLMLTPSCHNAWVGFLGSGGLIGFIGQVLLLSWVVFKLVLLCKRRGSFGALSITAFVSFVFLSVLENIWLTIPSYEMAAGLLLVILPAFSPSALSPAKDKAKTVERQALIKFAAALFFLLAPALIPLLLTTPIWAKVIAILGFVALQVVVWIFIGRKHFSVISACILVSANIVAIVLTFAYIPQGVLDPLALACLIFTINVTALTIASQKTCPFSKDTFDPLEAFCLKIANLYDRRCS